jgi:DNA polymerase I
LAEQRAAKAVAIAVLPPEASWQQPDLTAAAFSAAGGAAVVLPASLLFGDAGVRAEFAALLHDERVGKRVHDAKSLYSWSEATGFAPAAITFDTMLAAGLIDPSFGEPTLEQAARTAGVAVALPRSDGQPQPIGIFEGRHDLDPALGGTADAIFRASDALEERIAAAGETALLRDVELPLALVLARMERVGFRLDLPELDRIRAELDRLIALARAEIYRLAGEEFNVNSPKAIGEVLFERLHLPGGVKRKTGYATGSDVLAPLALEHPIARQILDYREVAKLKSTYVDTLPSLVDKKTGLLHTTLHQLGAATGRLSSTNPNLQNIPVRSQAGKAIRRAFLPPTPGNVLLAADYSQIELRLFAHLSGDANLLQAFAQGQDVHAFTARAVFGIPDGEPLDSELRRRAKAVNFGILYGMGSFGLAQSAGITRAEARDFIAQYFERFPQIREYIHGELDRARSLGFVTTILGRRRYLPDLRSSNHPARAAAERMATNAPLQGSAADLIKLAMVRVARALDDSRVRARMILQVHDELIFDVPPAQLDEVKAVVQHAMEHAMELDVALVVDFAAGPTWAEVE